MILRVSIFRRSQVFYSFFSELWQGKRMKTFVTTKISWWWWEILTFERWIKWNLYNRKFTISKKYHHSLEASKSWDEVDFLDFRIFHRRNPPTIMENIFVNQKFLKSIIPPPSYYLSISMRCVEGMKFNRIKSEEKVWRVDLSFTK